MYLPRIDMSHADDRTPQPDMDIPDFCAALRTAVEGAARGALYDGADLHLADQWSETERWPWPLLEGQIWWCHDVDRARESLLALLGFHPNGGKVYGWASLPLAVHELRPESLPGLAWGFGSAQEAMRALTLSHCPRFETVLVAEGLMPEWVREEDGGYCVLHPPPLAYEDWRRYWVPALIFDAHLIFYDYTYGFYRRAEDLPAESGWRLTTIDRVIARTRAWRAQRELGTMNVRHENSLFYEWEELV